MQVTKRSFQGGFSLVFDPSQASEPATVAPGLPPHHENPPAGRAGFEPFCKQTNKRLRADGWVSPYWVNSDALGVLRLLDEAWLCLQDTPAAASVADAIEAVIRQEGRPF